jgi:hypothetical protein
MRVFTCSDYAGHYPVGTASVIVAPDEPSARDLLCRALTERGFNDHSVSLTELDTSSPKAIVLRDGEY